FFFRYTSGSSVPEAAFSSSSRYRFLQCGQVNNSMRYSSTFFQCDQDTIDWHAMHKAFRSVEWIEDPAAVEIRSLRTIFFSEDDIVREVFPNAVPQIFLRFSIGTSNRAFITLRDNLKFRRLKILQCYLARTASDLFHK